MDKQLDKHVVTVEQVNEIMEKAVDMLEMYITSQEMAGEKPLPPLYGDTPFAHDILWGLYELQDRCTEMVVVIKDYPHTL